MSYHGHYAQYEIIMIRSYCDIVSYSIIRYLPVVLLFWYLILPMYLLLHGKQCWLREYNIDCEGMNVRNDSCRPTRTVYTGWSENVPSMTLGTRFCMILFKSTAVCKSLTNTLQSFIAQSESESINQN
jgi:hypothetical protein